MQGGEGKGSRTGRGVTISRARVHATDGVSTCPVPAATEPASSWQSGTQQPIPIQPSAPRGDRVSTSAPIERGSPPPCSHARSENRKNAKRKRTLESSPRTALSLSPPENRPPMPKPACAGSTPPLTPAAAAAAAVPTNRRTNCARETRPAGPSAPMREETTARARRLVTRRAAAGTKAAMVTAGKR